jgi:hypothetical protein
MVALLASARRCPLPDVGREASDGLAKGRKLHRQAFGLAALRGPNVARTIMAGPARTKPVSIPFLKNSGDNPI